MADMYNDLAARISPALVEETIANHAVTHEDGGDDELLVENLPTALTSGKVAASDGIGGLVSGLAIKEFVSAPIAFSDLGSGASSDEAIAGFPTNVIVLGASVEVDTAFDGEPDLAIQVGDAGDPDGLLLQTTIHGVAPGWLAALPGVQAGAHLEPAFSPVARFTATELDDVTVGVCKVHIFYAVPTLT